MQLIELFWQPLFVNLLSQYSVFDVLAPLSVANKFYTYRYIYEYVSSWSSIVITSTLSILPYMLGNIVYTIDPFNFLAIKRT